VFLFNAPLIDQNMIRWCNCATLTVPIAAAIVMQPFGNQDARFDGLLTRSLSSTNSSTKNLINSPPMSCWTK